MRSRASFGSTLFTIAVAAILAASCSDSGDSSESGTASGDAASAPAEWVLLGRDLANSRAAVDETAVGPDNVADLRPSWELADVNGVSGTPIVADGDVFIGDWTGHVRALDAATGEQRWDRDLSTNYIGGAVAIDDARVFVGTFDARLVALDRETGEPVWESPVGEDDPQSAVFGSPVVVDDLVIIGVASYEEFGSDAPTFRGHVDALDAATGEEVWRHYLTAGDETEGPGVSVWSSPAVDVDRGQVYVGTGQAYAPPASPRSNALVALDLETGDELWVRQFTPNDVWMLGGPDGPDADVGAPPNLFEVDGTDAIGVGDKGGAYHALNRDTGEEIWSHQLTVGGLQGGVMASAAVEGGRIYVASNRASLDADLVALDQGSGDEVWRVDVGGHVTGPVTWANGVVFVSDDTGRVAGYDADDGERLWSHEVAAPAAGGIAVVDGTVYAGWGWWLAAPPEQPQGGLIAFRVDGEAAAPDESGGASDESSAGLGEEIFTQSCAACHGGSGEGGSGPSLEGVDNRMSREEHIAVVTNGRGRMPGWEGTLSDEEIEAVVDYERSVLSAG